MKAFASTTARGGVTTAIYTSWDGATEVDEWRYYSAERGINHWVLLGSAEKDGFETSFVCKGFHPIVFVEAVDVHGKSLANSSLEMTELPPGWHRTDLGASLEELLESWGIGECPLRCS